MINGKFNSQKLKISREKMGLSFGNFADRLRKYQPKASKASCWQWEQGHQPSGRNLSAICKVLNKSPEFFYGK